MRQEKMSLSWGGRNKTGHSSNMRYRFTTVNFEYLWDVISKFKYNCVNYTGTNRGAVVERRVND